MKKLLRLVTIVLAAGTGGSFVAKAADVASPEAKYATPAWVLVAKNGVQLPSPKAPLEYVFAVMPRQSIYIHGNITQSSAATYNTKSGILLVNFYDAQGNSLKVEELIYSRGFDGYYSYLAGMNKPAPFSFELEVPEVAVKARVRIAGMVDGPDDVCLSNFTCTILNPTRAFWNVAAVSCLFVFSLLTMSLLRKSGKVAMAPVAGLSAVERLGGSRLWKHIAFSLAAVSVT